MTTNRKVGILLVCVGLAFATGGCAQDTHQGTGQGEPSDLGLMEASTDLVVMLDQHPVSPPANCAAVSYLRRVELGTALTRPFALGSDGETVAVAWYNGPAQTYVDAAIQAVSLDGLTKGSVHTVPHTNGWVNHLTGTSMGYILGSNYCVHEGLVEKYRADTTMRFDSWANFAAGTLQEQSTSAALEVASNTFFTGWRVDEQKKEIYYFVGNLDVSDQASSVHEYHLNSCVCAGFYGMSLAAIGDEIALATTRGFGSGASPDRYELVVHGHNGTTPTWEVMVASLPMPKNAACGADPDLNGAYAVGSQYAIFWDEGLDKQIYPEINHLTYVAGGKIISDRLLAQDRILAMDQTGDGFVVVYGDRIDLLDNTGATRFTYPLAKAGIEMSAVDLIKVKVTPTGFVVAHIKQTGPTDGQFYLDFFACK